MKISVRNLEPTKVKLTITVDPEEFNPYLDNARKEIAKQVNVPGFRKGHVPGKIIDQRIGFGAVAGEAVNNGVPELYSKALEEKGIHPMAQPEIDVQEVPESAKDETKLKFVATVERRPDIELPAIDGMEIEVAKAEITDEDINNRLEALRQRFGTLVGVDRPAAKGDYANIDLTAEINGEVVDSQEGVSYELGSETMLDGLDEALEGLSAGEETTFEGTLEAGDHEGEKAQIKVKVNSVKAEELPELDDDFASEASEFDTLDELKEDLKKAASQDAEGRQATAARDAFIAKLEEGLEIPVPKGVKAEMVEQQLKGVTADPANATKEQKAEAEETVEKELRDQMAVSYTHLTSIGTAAAIFPMIIMCTMATSRLVEQNLVPVDSGVIEAARAMGASKFTIVRTVLIPEALAPLILAYAFLFIGVLDMSAMAGYIGGGGLGNFAIAYGYQKFDQTVTWTAVIIMIVLVQVVQGVANAIAKHLLKR